MKDMMERARELADAGNDFNTIFNRLTGKLEVKAEIMPGNTCTIGEVRDLFDLLYDIKRGKYKKETPEVAASRESR